MPNERELLEAVIDAEIDALVEMGDAEVFIEDGVECLRITEQGLRKVRESEQIVELN